MNGALIEVEDLTVRFRTDEGLITAVESTSFQIAPGEVLGLVGESGSGKSVTAKSLMQLNAGNTRYDPSSRIRLHLDNGAVDVLGLRRARDHSVEMLERVGISDAGRRFDQYAFELSGGMRQRAMIAMALSTRPRLLIEDEPTTALDVTIQAQVIDLMKELVPEFGMAILFITHDLGVIAQTADRVAVMYLGRIVEAGPVREVLRSPAHPYTRGLLNALPKLDALDEPLTPVPGDIPSPLERPTGCVFHTRCPEVIQGRCSAEVPGPVETEKGHRASCLLLEIPEEPAPR